MSRKTSLFSLLFCILVLAVPSISWVDEQNRASENVAPSPNDIDAQIAALEQRKALLESRIRILSKDIQRLQFQDYLLARSYYQQQKQLEAQVDAIEKEIEALKALKR